VAQPPVDEKEECARLPLNATSPCSAAYVRRQRGIARIRPPRAAAAAIDPRTRPTAAGV